MPRFYSGHVTEVRSAWHVRKFQTPRKQAGVQHKPRCSYSLGTMHHSCQRIVGMLQIPTLQAGLSKNSVLRLLR